MRNQRHESPQGTCSGATFLSPDLQKTFILPPSNFIALIPASHLQRLDSSSCLKSDQMFDYIRKLAYEVTSSVRYDSEKDDDHLLSPILSYFLPTVSRLNSLTITGYRDWNTMDSSLTSAFLHLMHLPTIITSTSHLSQISQCLVPFYLSTCSCFGSI